MTTRPVSTTVHAPSAGFMHRLQQRCFNALYSRSLLYNACWEDPAVDRQALELGPDDHVLVITSAGCNALDYAIDGPARVTAVDANPQQTALLELKMAGIRELPYEDFFRIFGYGTHPDFTTLYRDRLRARISPASRRFWDVRRHWFADHGWRAGLYFQGLSGLVARSMKAYVDRSPKLRRGVDALLAARDLDEQRRVYDLQVAPRVFTAPVKWALGRQLTMSLLGVPTAQTEAVQASHEGGVAGFVRHCLDQVCRTLPFWDNYHWSVYMRGSYTPDCCPRYLSRAGFQTLKSGAVDRVVPCTTTVTEQLKAEEMPVSRFVLLDHMDWMGHYYPEALAEEWTWILERARPDARVLFRSGAVEPDFLTPLTVHRGPNARPLLDHCHFHRAWARDLHRQDRVGTYASFHIVDIDGAAT